MNSMLKETFFSSIVLDYPSLFRCFVAFFPEMLTKERMDLEVEANPFNLSQHTLKLAGKIHET